MTTIKVLSLDGGGVRGIITARLLEMFCEKAGLEPQELYKYFDIIAGTSIGGIQALGYAQGFTPTYVKNLLIDNASTIFNCNAPIGGQASYGTWAAYLTGVYDSLYPQGPLKDLINTNFPTALMSDCKTNVLVPAFQTQTTDPASGLTLKTNVPVYFSNVSSALVPYLSGGSELVQNVALATSAAPVYFPKAVFGGATYVDGGVFLNNPSALALSIQKAVSPATNRFCVLSLGTGLGSIGYIPSEPSVKAPQGASDNLNTIKMVLDVSMSIPPEGVSVEQNILSTYALENLYYLRLQYPIDLTLWPDASLDNSSEDFISYMQESATQYFNDNVSAITTFIGHFLA